MAEHIAVLDELEVKTHFNLEEAISSLKFWWNIAQHKGESVTFIITGTTKTRGGYQAQTKERR